MMDGTLGDARRLVSGLATGALSMQDVVSDMDVAAGAAEQLNALAAYDSERAHRIAASYPEPGRAGPVGGLPVLAKDAIDTADLPTTGGTPALTGRLPPVNAPVVERLVAAGAWIAAKTTMHELSFGITSNNAWSGPVCNPYQSDLIAGGSSGGAAAAVAAGIAPVSLAADTGGSARLPAAMCGVVGFRPTHGRYPGDGVVPISHTRDTVGVIARRVSDVVLLDAVLAEQAQAASARSLTGVRLGVPKQFWRDLDRGVATTAGAARDLLSDAGVELVEVDITGVMELNAAVGFPVCFYEFPRELARYLSAAGYELTTEDVRRQVASPDVAGVWELLAGDGAVNEDQYQEALDARLRLQQEYATVLSANRLSALVFPTAPLTARPIGDDDTIELNGQRQPTFATYIRNTDLSGNAGHPGISIPAGLAPDGLPVGIELDAAVGDDEALLALAAAIEHILPPTPAPVLSPTPSSGGRHVAVTAH
ncbi:MAG: indoleacetamide hydrolase [Actinomycetota bacterium]|nr:indoleacetamide hydrolase [Actinomycetota bacterium]